MGLFTDNRGYSYIGSQLIGTPGTEVYGDRQHSSSVNGSTTSEMGLAMQAQYGNGKWGIASSPTSWTGDISATTWADLLWTPASITKAGAIDITTYTSSSSALTDLNGDTYVFGTKLHGTSGRGVINTDSGGNLIQAGAPFFNNHTELDRVLYCSVTPNSLGIFAIEADKDNPRFWYSCLLQGGNLAAPQDRFSCYKHNTNNAGRRPLSFGDTSGQATFVTASVYADTLATASNATGDPYLTRWYPLDNGGTTSNLSAGYAPELYLLHSSAVAVGDIINVADLDGGGLYDNGNFDGSNFTYLICMHNMSSSKRLMMRIGTDTATL